MSEQVELYRNRILKLKRQILGYSLQYFADKMECDKATIYYIERDNSREFHLNFYERVMNKHNDELKQKIPQQIDKLCYILNSLDEKEENEMTKLPRGEILKMKREILGLSAVDIALIIGCEKQTIYRIERGETTTGGTLRFYEYVLDNEIKQRKEELKVQINLQIKQLEFILELIEIEEE